MVFSNYYDKDTDFYSMVQVTDSHFPLLLGSKLEKPITPFSVDELDIKGTVPFLEMISSLLKR